MWKINISMVVLLIVMFYGIITFNGPSKEYWESVGPKWDRMLNPNKYSDEE